jgi:hypothetical protein
MGIAILRSCLFCPASSATNTSPYGKLWSGRGEYNGVGPSLKLLTILGDRAFSFVSPRKSGSPASSVTDAAQQTEQNKYIKMECMIG